jgi:hypothetical protein
MTEEFAQRILEHLRHIRRRVDQLADDMAEIRSRAPTYPENFQSLEAPSTRP